MSAPKTPWITLLLIAVNIIAAFAAALFPEWALVYGLRPSSPTALSFFANTFLHHNILHLLGNMVFLAAVGPAVELGAGRWRFLIVYLLGGVAGNLAHLALMGSIAGGEPLVGASGSIAACIGYFAVRYHSLRAPVFPNVEVPVVAIVVVWLGLQVMGGLVQVGHSIGSTAYWAHLGGFLFGLLASLIFKAPSVARVERERATQAEMDARSPAAAMHHAEELLKRDPDDPHALRSLADAQRAIGDEHHESKTLVKLFGLAETTAEQKACAIRLIEMGRLEEIATLGRLKLADGISATDPELARTLLASVVNGPRGDKRRPDAILSLALLLAEEDPAESKKLASELLRLFPMHPAAEIARAKGLRA